jgi:uncharacterized membrane protein
MSLDQKISKIKDFLKPSTIPEIPIYIATSPISFISGVATYALSRDLLCSIASTILPQAIEYGLFRIAEHGYFGSNISNLIKIYKNVEKY